MSFWLIDHAPEVGVFCLGFVAGVVFAAHRQLQIEQRRRELRRWLREQRSI